MKLNEMQKRLGIILGVVVVVIILVLIGVSIFGGVKTYTHEEVEEKLVSAAKAYYKDNESELPANSGEEVTMPAATLESEGYITSIKKLLNTDTACFASVSTTKYGESYFYTSELDCGDEYTTLTLIDQITENEAANTKTALVSEGELSYYVGEDVNNHIKFDTHFWRIISIDENGINIILASDDTFGNAWDDRYNEDLGYNTGFNDFSKSRIKTYMEDEILGTYFSEEAFGYLATQNVCVDPMGEESKVTTSYITNCDNFIENQRIRLPYAAEFVLASDDESCSLLGDKSCQNYNYFDDFSKSFWTGTPVSGTSNEVYYVSSVVNNKKALSYYRVYPVVTLNKNVGFEDGDGSKENPYEIK